MLVVAIVLYVGTYVVVRVSSYTILMPASGSDQMVRVVYLGLSEEEAEWDLFWGSSEHLERLRTLNRIFKPLQRVDRSLTGTYSTTGLVR